MMRLLDIQHIGNEIAIKWDDGREDFILLEKLRRACLCAGCKGETDILGNVYNTDFSLRLHYFEDAGKTGACRSDTA
jgi:Gamma-butyrobetaine hydroxylase-like, N-terminal